jgi:hypothetical protein
MEAVKQDRKLAVEIHTPTYLGHPYLLAWSHLYTFRESFNTDESITHFMYLEDDILITEKNIEYSFTKNIKNNYLFEMKFSLAA